MKTKMNIIIMAVALVVGICVGFGGALVWKSISKNTDDSAVEKESTQIANPVAGMSEEEAFQIALELAEGKDMGTWKTMTADEFLRWWKDCNE